MLQLKNVCVSVEEKEIVKGVDLQINKGEVHALLGPNGAGKSTLCHAIMGHPNHKVSGSILFEGMELNGSATDERARKGIFLAFQNPVEVEGIDFARFLRDAYKARHNSISPKEFRQNLASELKRVGLPESFSSRSLNLGFSGGEKKRAEVLQMSVLRPKLALIDEPDSGLDVDAIKIVAEKIQETAKAGTGILLVTHLSLLKNLSPDFVHIMSDGRIVESGGADLVQKIERQGFGAWKNGN